MEKSKIKMIDKNSKINLPILFALSFSILIFTFSIFPSFVSASTVYIDTGRPDFFVGDTILFSVRVDSLNKDINAVEGDVVMDYGAESASLLDINTAGSRFSLWPTNPSPSESNTSISFAGGSPGGLNSKDAIIFNIVLKLQKEGQVTLTPTNLSVYLHDGKGTKDAVSVRNLVIDVVPKKSDSQSVDDWSSLISSDTTPPEPFDIYAGQEGSVYDGKKFLSFSTTDTQSGIAYYEVIEGTLPPIRSRDTYVLYEQNKPVKVTIIAYDSAGNARESIYSSMPYTVPYPVIIIIVIMILILALVIYKKRKRFL